jgi:RES domain-containing protein
MLGVADFERALVTAPTTRLRRLVVRMIPYDWLDKGKAPDFLFASGKPNRFNTKGVECVYFSDGEKTAGAEYLRWWSGTAGEHQPRVTYFARVRLQYVLDLTQEETLSALGLTGKELCQPWRLATSPTPTQMLGTALSRQTRIPEIRYPSDAARAKGTAGANIVVFRNSIRTPDRVDILGPDKEPLQSWH